MSLDPLATFAVPATPWHYLSLGGGVQSSCMALMAAHGQIKPLPDAAIFADTQSEPRWVYEWLDYLQKAIAAAPHPFPVHTVTAGNLEDVSQKLRTTADGREYFKTAIPFFTLSPEGKPGKIQKRACTHDYKILPMLRFIKKEAGLRGCLPAKPVVTQWIGISWDEMQRAKTARDPGFQNRFPLLELRMSRKDCHAWMHANGYPQAPKSACTFCPFHNNSQWQKLKVEEPETFKRICALETSLNDSRKRGCSNLDSTVYLHPKRVPLGTIVFTDETQTTFDFQDERDECAGGCFL